MIFPTSLKKEDKIMILSPASAIDQKLVEGAAATLKSWGFEPIISAHCLSTYASYSGTIEERKQDLIKAFEDDSIKAILCSRGGYGTVHLLEFLPASFIQAHPKWVIGFSDITAFHARMVSAGICSIHAPMCKHLAELGGEEKCNVALKNILEGALPTYDIAPHQYNHMGKAKGKIIGGNMAVMCGLASTKVDLIEKGTILFIEDVSEAVYKIERMLYLLKLNGTLSSLKGLIVGQFTEYDTTQNVETMYEMIHRMTQEYDYPIAFNFPAGHVDYNLPIIEGANVELEVTTQKTTLSFKGL